MSRDHSFEHLRAVQKPPRAEPARALVPRGCPWGPCNYASYRRCSRSGVSRFDPSNADACGAPECAAVGVAT